MIIDSDDTSEFSDREARCAIVAAEARGFEREPDLHGTVYDHDLHVDAEEAAEFLRREDPAALEVALSSPDPLPTWAAVDRLMDEGKVSLADVRAIVEAALARGFEPAEPDPMIRLLVTREWEEARGHLAFLWDNHHDVLTEILGGAVRLAALPDTAIERIVRVPHKYAGPLPVDSDGRERVSGSW